MKLYAPLVEGEIEKAAYISFTMDIWTNTSNTAFISPRAHFIDPVDIVQKVFTLTTKHFPDSHTGINISKVLNEILDEWKINRERVHILVHDNAAKMNLGAELLLINHIGCFINALQLVIHDAIFSQRTVKDIISKCRAMMGHFSHSALGCQRLKDIQTTLKLSIHKLIQDVPTRLGLKISCLLIDQLIGEKRPHKFF